MFDEIRLVNESLRFAPREALIAYTDGVTEALNPEGRGYGSTRLLKTVASGPQDAAGLMAHLLADHGGFIGEAAASDDITLLILGCSP
jgi:sigma-B regulation protein RsbU (phosphoserine phosphatase)